MDGTTDKKYCCVECGEKVDELYRVVHRVIKIAHCESCTKVADKYIEYDPVLISLDAFLHKPQAYRHILRNADIKWVWKFWLILILCDTYQHWENLDHHNQGEPSVVSAALELSFYKMFLLSITEWVITWSVVFVFLLIWSRICKEKQRIIPGDVARCIVISSFGKLCLIPASIWGQSQSSIYQALAQLLVVTSSTTALHVYFRKPRWICLISLLCATSIQYSATLYSLPEISNIISIQ